MLSSLLLFGCQPKKKALVSDPSVRKQGDMGQRLDSLLTPYVRALRQATDNTAGLAIGVTKGDSIVYARTFGHAQLASKKKVDFATPFHLASVSKPFSAIAIAKLIQDGKLRLDDPLVNLIPEFQMQGEGYDEITIEHILTHTSGIPRNIAVDDWLHPSFGPKALEENLDIVKNKELDFAPGTKFSYSNSAFDILGVVISRASGLSFAEYIEQEIFGPIGMDNASFVKPADISASHWAMAYSYGLETQELSPYPYNERLFPSSGVVASVSDLCKWGQFHVGRGRIGGKQVLAEEWFDLVVSPKYDTPWGDQIGLSWFLQSYLDRPIIMHTGFDTGFESMMYIYPEEGISIVVLANRDFSRTGRIINAVSEILFGQTAKEYELSAKYLFADAYKKKGMDHAISLWADLKKDTTDAYFVDDGDILTTAAILENGGHWHQTKEILDYYLTINDKSTYAWRLLGNANLYLRDTAAAKSCYRRTLEINPEYEKGRVALEKLGG